MTRLPASRLVTSCSVDVAEKRRLKDAGEAGIPWKKWSAFHHYVVPGSTVAVNPQKRPTLSLNATLPAMLRRA